MEENKSKPITAWGYAGYQLLFAIPIAGFIMLIIYSCGGTDNVHLRNLARSYFCILLIVVAIIVLFLAFGGSLLYAAILAKLLR